MLSLRGRICGLILAFSIIETLCDECPNGWTFNHISSECYFLSEKLYTFDEYLQLCQSIGGKPVVLTTSSEKNAFADLTNSTFLQPWIGSRRNTTTGSFFNVDKSYFYSSMWAANEPSLNGNCVTFKAKDSAGMVVSHCDQLQPAFCKQTPALCNSGTFGGQLIRSGTIQSPGYPIQYYNNLKCSYLINSPNGTFITIDFEPFLIESFYDSVRIYNGNSTNYLDFIGEVSSSYKKSFESKSNQMLIIFYSNYAITNKGWQAKWTAKAQTKPISQSGNNGSMTSPNYPKNYDSYTEQLYYISVPYGFQINITIDDFYTEKGYDLLQIYNSSYTYSQYLIANLSGSSIAPWNWLSPSNKVSLKFTSDSMIQYRGWHLNWHIQ